MKHLKVRQKYCAAHHIFSLSSQCFIWWWNTASHAWYLASKIASLLHRPLEGGGGRHITTCYQWVPNWLFWLWDFPYLKARIWGLKATWWDSGSKVCWGCGIPKIGIWIPILYTIHFGEWRIGKLCYGPKKYLHGRLFYYKHWSQRWKPWYLSGNLYLYNTITFYNGQFFFSLM